MSRKIAFIGNQGGHSVISFYVAMVKNLTTDFDAIAIFSVWLDSEKGIPSEMGLHGTAVTSFESFVRNQPIVDDVSVAHFIRKYRGVNWSEVVAVERAFTDYSMLIDSAGERRESVAYVQQLVVNMVNYLESVMIDCDAIVCQTADTLFSLVAIKLARHLGIRSFAIRPATLLEPGKGGGFFANTEYLECDRMIASFNERQSRTLSPEERVRTDALIRSIRDFDGSTSFHAATSKGKSRGRRALSPNISSLLSYLRENSRRDKNIEYIKINPKRKILGNLLRVWRKWMSRNSYGSISVDVIPPYISDKFESSKLPAKPIIAVHSREQRDTLNLIKSFYVKFPQYRWITFKDMRGLSESEFAKTMQDCFLSVWIDETSGFGTFPLESMKMGIPVLGLVPNLVPHWMSEENGLWVNNKTQIVDFVADFLQNWLEDNVSEEMFEAMKKTTSEQKTKEEFDTLVIESFSDYMQTRLNSFEEQLNKFQVTE